MHHVALSVTEHLNFQVLRPGNITLKKNSRIAEGTLGFALGFLQHWFQVFFLGYHPHPSAPSTEGSLDNQWKTYLPPPFQCLAWLGDSLGRGRQSGNACLIRGFFCSHFVTHAFEQFRSRSDKGDTSVFTGSCKLRVLREETVTRVNEIDTLFLGKRNNRINVKVSRNRTLSLTDQISFVGLEPMNTEPVFLCINGNCPKIKFSRRAKYTDGDFTTIGNKEFFHGENFWIT